MAGPPPMGMPPPRPFKNGGRIANLGKFAHGGKVRQRQAGGRADWQGEGDSGKPMKEKSAEASAKAGKWNRDALDSGATGLIGAGIGATGPKMRDIGVIGKTLKGGTLGMAAATLGAAALKKMGANAKEKEAASANAAGDEAEGRQMGGPAMGMAKPMQRRIPPAVAQAIAAKRGMMGGAPPMGGPKPAMPMPMRANGGRLTPGEMTAGACSGEGREEKAEMVRKHHGK